MPAGSGSVQEGRVSVVVPTRNRAEHAVGCARSILANAGGDFEVLVVDQSDDDRTRDALAPLGADPRFRYRRTATRGVSRSRNIGMGWTSAPIIAFTDDDCRVDGDWIASLSAVFAADADAAVVFGRVQVPGDVDGHTKYAASFEPGIREYQHRFPRPDAPWGIGANMAFRRSTFARIGAFDPLLGPGAVFPAAEEYDIAIRALAAGMKVVNAAEVSVLHLGVREGHVASALVRGYGVAIGAALAKHARSGPSSSRRLLGDWVGVHGWRALRNAATGTRPTNLGFVASMVGGALRSCLWRIDGASMVYEDARERTASGDRSTR
jgi:glycosyltransferase involved in cell wall biosynthesis